MNQMYKQIVDYVYDFMGAEKVPGGIQGNDDGYVYAMQNARVQSMYRFLDKGALTIKPDTYKKLHRIITECMTYDGPGVFVQRWMVINPRMEMAAEVHDMLGSMESNLSVDDDEYVEEFLEPIKGEIRNS